ncbi:MAG: DUF819 family protein [Bacteroidota bacterium]
MEESGSAPLLTNDAVIFGILMSILAVIFYTSSSKKPFWKKFYSIIPMVLLCYFIPSFLHTFGVVDPEQSRLYFVASRYLLPACLVLLTLSLDLKEVIKLGPKSLIMFFTATIGVIIGGPLAILIVSAIAPDVVGGVGPEAVWRGMTTIAGSWIGGTANQTAMKELYEPSKELFTTMVTVDVVVAEIWMMALLIGVSKAKQIDKFFKADTSSIQRLRTKIEDYQLSIARIPSTADIMTMLGLVFAATALSHYVADLIVPEMKILAEEYDFVKSMNLTKEFFWIVLVATTLGIGLSFTKARTLEGAGASKIGVVFIFILVAVIGMEMDIRDVAENPGLFMVGVVWMIIHVILLLIVGKLIKAPYFFLAVGSKANIGGAASAPVIAAAFHPALAPVGVLLAVLGYVLGTYGAVLCARLMQLIAV